MHPRDATLQRSIKDMEVISISVCAASSAENVIQVRHVNPRKDIYVPRIRVSPIAKSAYVTWVHLAAYGRDLVHLAVGPEHLVGVDRPCPCRRGVL